MRVTHAPQTRCLPHEHTRLTRCATVHARPSLRHRVPRLALPASRSGGEWPTVPPPLSSRLALRGALNRDAQQPFCYASFLLWLRVCTKATRVRVTSRKAHMSGGGTKLGRMSPWANSSAIQAASRLSVFLPGRL